MKLPIGVMNTGLNGDIKQGLYLVKVPTINSETGYTDMYEVYVDGKFVGIELMESEAIALYDYMKQQVRGDYEY